MLNLILILLTQPALASVATTYECEFYLGGDFALRAERDLENFVFDRPFGSAERGRLSQAGFKRLGLPAELANRNSRIHLIASIHRTHQHQDFDEHGELIIRAFGRDGLTPVLNTRIADLHPILWQKMTIGANAARGPSSVPRTPAHLRQRGPLIGHYAVGYASDPRPDLNGGRTYVRATHQRESDQTWLEFGVDVPCADLDQYLGDVDRRHCFWSPLTSNSVEYCRVPALTFERANLGDD